MNSKKLFVFGCIYYLLFSINVSYGEQSLTKAIRVNGAEAIDDRGEAKLFNYTERGKQVILELSDPNSLVGREYESVIVYSETKLEIVGVFPVYVTHYKNKFLDVVEIDSRYWKEIPTNVVNVRAPIIHDQFGAPDCVITGIFLIEADEFVKYLNHQGNIDSRKDWEKRHTLVKKLQPWCNTE